MSSASPSSLKGKQAPRLIWRRGLLLFFVTLISVGYWSLPIRGQVLLVPENWRDTHTWPQVRFEPEQLQIGQKAMVSITDITPWTNVKLTIGGTEATFERYDENSIAKYWTWHWSFIVPSQPGSELTFYYSCDTGCIERTKLTLSSTPLNQTTDSAEQIPTKLGIVFANPKRDWHHRSGWDVELTYAQQAEKEYWGIDDLSERVQNAAVKGLRVIVRVDYDQGQSLPPANDFLALDIYLSYIRRLVRDERLKPVYGYSIGSGYNTKGSNSQAPDHPVTPEWYARIFNGYGVEPAHTDNVMEIIHAENPAAQVLVGPVRPWNNDQDGRTPYQIGMPWLNYMNTLVAALDASAQANEALGIPFTAPDGFAVQAPGHPSAPELESNTRAKEPQIDLRQQAWSGAQAGFRVYQDWLNIINHYPHTQSLPIYITSTNTFEADSNVRPAENYPKGWLSTAFEVVNQEPQILALCWFLDEFPLDTQWELFSLTSPRGLLVDAADEFDRLLILQP